MTEEEILKFINLAVGRVSATGDHGVDMDTIVPNVDLLGRVTTELVSTLHLTATAWEERPEDSIKAVGMKARYWIDFIETEILDIKKPTNDGSR